MHIWTLTALKSSLLASALHPQQPRESYTLRYATRSYRLECRVCSRTCSDSAARKCLRHWQDHLNVVRLGRHLRESVEGVGGVAGSSRSSIGQCLYIPARLGAHGFFVGSTELGPSATRPDLEILFTQVHHRLRNEISFQALCGRPCSSKGKAQTSARKSEKTRSHILASVGTRVKRNLIAIGIYVEHKETSILEDFCNRWDPGDLPQLCNISGCSYIGHRSW